MIETLNGLWAPVRDFPYLGYVLAAAWLLYMVGLSLWIVLQKREPVATLSWVLSLSLLPYLGFLIYFLLGPQRIRRQRLRRGRSRSGMQRLTAAFPPDDECAELARVAQAATGFPPASATSARWLVDGGATFDALVQAIAAARDHVHVEYYIFADDRSGTRLRDALVERARAGVEVRMLLDALGSRPGRRFLRPLREAGVEVAWFHPTRLRPFTRPWVNMRNHRKLVIVDGRIAFTGGINITDDQNERVNPRAHRDLHLCLGGEVVRNMQLVFVEDWIYATGQDPLLLARPELWPRDGDGGGAQVQAQVLVSGPDSPWETIHRLQVGAIHAARRRVWLATPYFVPGEAARMALTSAGLAGLDVRLLVPKECDSRLVTLATRSYFDELLEAGVRVYEYGPRMLHTKALVIDDELCVIGSANFDQRSFRLNFELSMLLRGRELVGELAALLEGEFASAALVRHDRRRPLWRQRLPEAFARLLSPVL